MIEIVKADRSHIPALAAAMRQEERDECAALGYAPGAAVEAALSWATMAWTGKADGVPVCMFGVTAPSFVAAEAKPWLLSTDGIYGHQIAFLRRNRALVRDMLRIYRRLADHVDARNAVSIKWLRWLGFTVGDPVPWGVNGELFCPFEMEA